MPSETPPRARQSHESTVLVALILFQVLCTVFFVADILADIGQLGWDSLTDWHLVPEIAACLGLISGIVGLAFYLARVLRRQAHMERGMSVAQGALASLIDGYFATWGLTPSEADVATFTIKGYAIAEIAVLRGSREATVKTHLNAIYRKAGVAGRGQLVSLLIEDLMRGPITGTAPANG